MQPFETNEYYYNKRFHAKTFHNLQPVYFSIPIVAFRVRYLEFRNPDNIIEQTIFKLKKIGYSDKRIADAMCLNPHVVQSVLEYYSASENAEGKISEPTKMQTGYLVYDCYRERFFDEVVPEEEFTSNTDLYLEDRNQYTFKFRESLSDSRYYIVRPLQKLDGYAPAPSTPSQEMMLSVFMQRGARIGSDFYSHAEYLNERKTLQMVCAVYADHSDCSALNVSSVIRSSNIRLRIQFERILEKYPNENSFLSERVKQLKQSIIDGITDVTSEKWEAAHEEAARTVAEKYGTGIRRYSRVFRRACELDVAHAQLKAAQNDPYSDAYMAACGAIKVASHHLLEETFIASFFRYYDDDARMACARLNKSTAGPEVLCGYMRAIGFQVDESNRKFMKGVQFGSLKYGVFQLGGPPEVSVENPRINLWLVANVILGRITKVHPVKKLAEVFPKIIEQLNTTLLWRNDSAHDNSAQKPEFFGVDQADALIEFCGRILRIMLEVEHAGGVALKEQAVEAGPSLNLPIEQDVKEITTQSDEIIAKAKKMARSFYQKDAGFFNSACNYLHAVLRGYLSQIYDEETHGKLFEGFPEDIDEGNALINRILSANDISAQVVGVVKKWKLQPSQAEMTNYTLTAILYLLILFIEKKHPLLFAEIPNFGEIVAKTDEVVHRRGHSESADFASRGEEYEKLYRILLKFAKEYKE